MAKTHFRLHPGEEVRTPSIALLFWQGSDRMAGHNLFRRFILAHHTPRPGGKPLVLPICHGVGYGGPFPCNEYVCATESYAIGMIERLHQFGIDPDACWIDAGWYENPTNQWWSGVGTWDGQQEEFPARPEARHRGGPEAGRRASSSGSSPSASTRGPGSTASTRTG